jgi:hypothetical protein
LHDDPETVLPLVASIPSLHGDSENPSPSVECCIDAAVVSVPEAVSFPIECRTDAAVASEAMCCIDAAVVSVPVDAPETVLPLVASILALHGDSEDPSPPVECCIDAAVVSVPEAVSFPIECRADAAVARDAMCCIDAAVVREAVSFPIECRADAAVAREAIEVHGDSEDPPVECCIDAAAAPHAESAAPHDQPEPTPESHEVEVNLWSCDCSVCHSRRMYFLALEEVVDPLCLPGVGGSARSELCGELCARLAARSSLHAVDWRSVLEKLAAKISDEMPAVVQTCRGSGRDLAQRHYGRFLDSLEALFCELL